MEEVLILSFKRPLKLTLQVQQIQWRVLHVKNIQTYQPSPEERAVIMINDQQGVKPAQI
ncbi:MAG: hypothetical protein ACI88H_001565, partial [Cocleimonas sp.]